MDAMDILRDISTVIYIRYLVYFHFFFSVNIYYTILGFLTLALLYSNAAVL